MASFKCPCGKTKDERKFTTRIIDGVARNDVRCECGEFMKLTSPKSGVPSFSSDKWGRVR